MAIDYGITGHIFLGRLTAMELDMPKIGSKEHGESKNGRDSVDVSVSTTAGVHPDVGFNTVSAQQKVRIELEKAAKELKIKNTIGWVATVNENSGRRIVAVEQSYVENRLAGQVELDWGPTEGGGG